MRKIALLLTLLALVASQEVIVENWTGQYETGQQVSKEYRNPAWNAVQDFAVYGWFKINSALPRQSLSTIFHLTQNDLDFGFSKYIGDRYLTLFLQTNNLVSSTYRPKEVNLNSDVSFKDSDTDKWVFFYVAYGFEKQRRQAYFELPSGTQQNFIEKVGHYTSEFYRIYIGQSGTYKYFPGSLAKITLHGGRGSYRESNFSQLQNYNPNIPAPPVPVTPPVPDTGIPPTPTSAAPSTPPTPIIPTPKCPQIYTECNYTGISTDLCESKPYYDVKSIKSIVIPQDYTVTIHDSINYAGKKVTYNTSIECITEFNWSFLVDSHAITITQEKTHLKRNSHKRH